MKKILPITSILFVAILFSSCKKEYTCICTTTSTLTGFVPITNTYSLGKQTKKKAESACKDYSAEASSGGITTTKSCGL